MCDLVDSHPRCGRFFDTSVWTKYMKAEAIDDFCLSWKSVRISSMCTFPCYNIKTNTSSCLLKQVCEDRTLISNYSSNSQNIEHQIFLNIMKQEKKKITTLTSVLAPTQMSARWARVITTTIRDLGNTSSIDESICKSTTMVNL